MRSALLLTFLFLCRISAVEPKTLIVLGDSIAAGYGIDQEEAFPALLQQQIRAAGLNYRVVNAGVSGDTTAGGARRINWLLKNKFDAILIELGGNDGLRGISPAETEKNLQTIIDQVRAKNPSALIAIAGMQMAANMGQQYNDAFRDLFPKVAARNKAALIPFLLEGVGGKPELNQADRIHPTPEGHKIVAENLWKVLRPLLEPAA